MNTRVAVSSVVAIVAATAGVVVASQLGGDSTGEVAVSGSSDELLDCEYIDVIDFDEPRPENTTRDTREPREIADEFVQKRTPAATRARVKTEPEVATETAKNASGQSEAVVVYRNAKNKPEIRIYLEKGADAGWRLTKSEACPAEPITNNSRVRDRDPDEAKRQEELRRQPGPEPSAPNR
jgi:hypothetical protein